MLLPRGPFQSDIGVLLLKRLGLKTSAHLSVLSATRMPLSMKLPETRWIQSILLVQFLQPQLLKKQALIKSP